MERAHLPDIGLDGKTVLSSIPIELDERNWTYSTWRRKGKSDRLL
jgi:hypothetical protein